MNLLLGDCLEQLKSLPDDSVHSIVSDPPYGISFMGKKWDYDVPSVKIWKECLRVLKPGGYLLAFAGSRTYHVMAMRIENAGFDICDQIMWIYGSGFPKSHNISKAIDKKVGAKRPVVGSWNPQGTAKPVKGKKGHSAAHTTQAIEGYEREEGKVTLDITAAASPAAKKWEGWGTALKPAHEPIVMAQKPIAEDTIEFNVLKHGTGGLNVGETKIGDEERISASASASAIFGSAMKKGPSSKVIGRWPANVILGEESQADLDRSQGQLPTMGVSRYFYVPKCSKSERNSGLDGPKKKVHHDGRKSVSEVPAQRHSIENQNFHPTVKPIALMEYLIKMVTPPKGVVLDPFMGSGTTGCAAARLGFKFVGCELNPEYFEIAKARIDHCGPKKTIIRKNKSEV